MALILDGYDLSGGETRTTSYIAAPTNVDSQVLLGTVVGRVIFYHEKRNSTGDWIPIKSGESKTPMAFSTINEVEDGDTLQGLAGADYSIRVVPVGTVTGTLSIDVETDGTVTAF